MTDSEIISAIEWTARGKVGGKGKKWQIAANLSPLAPGDVYLGECVTFKFNASRMYVLAATRGLQRRLLKRYHKYNTGVSS